MFSTNKKVVICIWSEYHLNLDYTNKGGCKDKCYGKSKSVTL